MKTITFIITIILLLFSLPWKLYECLSVEPIEVKTILNLQHALKLYCTKHRFFVLQTDNKYLAA